MIDYHTHHDRCGHAQGSLREMVEAAISKGIKQLGLSDHSPYFFMEGDHPRPGLAMASSEFPNYIDEMVMLRDEYRQQIDIRLGVESDFIPGWEATYREIYDNYPLDYIIGSVHLFDGYHVYDRTRWDQPQLDVNQVYISYFKHVQRSAQSGLFDIIGHMDAIKAMKQQPTINISSLLDETAQVIKECDVAVELNTSGIRKCDEVFPSLDLLERLQRLAVPFTFGSDSHSPQELVDSWEHVIHLLQQLGVKELATFKNRKRDMLPIDV